MIRDIEISYTYNCIQKYTFSILYKQHFSNKGFVLVTYTKKYILAKKKMLEKKEY